MDWVRRWLVDFNAGKTQLVSFDWSNNTDNIDVKMNWSVLEKKSSFKVLGLTFSSKLGWTLTSLLLLKLPPSKLELWLILWSFFLLRLLCISVNLPYAHAWNTVVMSGLVPCASSCYLEYLDKVQKRICRTVGLSLATSLEPLAHCRNVASLLSHFYRYCFGRCSFELAQLVLFPFLREVHLLFW